MMGSSRTIGVARLGGNAGTNRDPALYEAARQADWAWLTGGRELEKMRPGRVRLVNPTAENPWKMSNLYYMRNPKRVRGAK
jgi:hypothetical protein